MPSRNAHRSGSRKNSRRPRDSGNANATEAGENDESRENREPPGKDESPTIDGKAPRFAQAIKQLFREVKKAITGEAPAPQPTQRRRKEETRGGLMMPARRFASCIVQRQFRKLADALRQPVAPSILDNLYAPRPYDPEQERAAAERFLRMQIDEWTHGEDQTQEQDGSFRYARAAGFDPHP
jgi:hypothetical protein